MGCLLGLAKGHFFEGERGKTLVQHCIKRTEKRLLWIETWDSQNAVPPVPPKKQLHQDPNNKAGGKNTGKNKNLFHYFADGYLSGKGTVPQHPQQIPPVNSSST